MSAVRYYLLLFVGSSLLFLLTLTPWLKALYQEGVVSRRLLSEGFADTAPLQPTHRTEKAFETQSALFNQAFEPYSTAKRPVVELLENEQKVSESERILLNFQTLACRYPGFLGPLPSGYMDPEIGILHAIKAGCRTFVLDIDYIDDCASCKKDTSIAYFPRLVVRDIQRKLLINEQTQAPLCQNLAHFELRTICQLINDRAFTSSALQATDPIIIVLYFHRRPPGSLSSKAVLDYYSAVARALSPFKDRLLTNELEGGKFYRHQQEGKLLMNKITNYNGKVLIFNNANTSGFQTAKTYNAAEDLDFLTNLRLFSSQTKLGVTEAATGGSFGILQTVEDYLSVPDDRKDQVKGETTQKWSIALSSNPIQMPTKEVYETLTTTYGVQCVPALLFDPALLTAAAAGSSHLFQDQTFKKYSFRYKPEALRYKRPPVVSPGQPNPSIDMKEGRLSLSGL